MPDPGEALALVREDVERGMGGWLNADAEIDGAGFRLLEPFDAEGVPKQQLSDGDRRDPVGVVGPPRR